MCDCELAKVAVEVKVNAAVKVVEVDVNKAAVNVKAVSGRGSHARSCLE